MKKALIFLMVLLLVPLSVFAAGQATQLSFSCDKTQGNPGTTVSCTGNYQGTQVGPMVIETCIAPTGGFLTIWPTHNTGQCVAGETFCYANSVIVESVGQQFTLSFTPVVPSADKPSDSKAWNGYGSNYQIQKTSVSMCCADGPCEAESPYNWIAVQSGFTITQPVTCPNGACGSGESCTTCPQDCGTCPVACSPGQTASCVAPSGCTGTKTCDSTNKWGECTSTLTKCTDTGACSSSCSSCGDFICSGSETAQNCPQDCLVQTCGNKICEANIGETEQNCPSDCEPWYKTYIWYIVGGIVAIFAILIGYTLYKKSRRK